MGLFSSSKKTTNNQTTVNDYTTTLTDNRYSEMDLAEGAVGVTGDVGGALTITSTDHGALANAAELSMRALDYGEDSLELGYDFAGNALSEAIGSVTGAARDFAQLTQRSLESTQSAYNTANTSEDGKVSQKMMLYLAIVVAIWLLAPVLLKLK